jgi:citrate/tricarballylate utilization protein
MPNVEILNEARRAIEICNACRYCEGYCAVFPAMERRRIFSDSDMNYLANLCHNCRGCFYACQFSPPHEFNVNIPAQFSALRVQTYQDYAWPGALGKLFNRNGLVVSLVMAVSLMLVMGLALLMVNDGRLFGTHTGAGAFYAVIPYGVMVYTASAVFGFVVLAMVIGFTRFLRDTGKTSKGDADTSSLWSAVWDVLTMKNMAGGGLGCNYPDHRFSGARRWHHQFVMYGFGLCFAATSVATIYDHVFDWAAPYAYTSLPVILGTLGGIGLTIGSLGLLWLKGQSDPEIADTGSKGMDIGFLVLLLMTAVTGLALLAFRETSAMGILLVIHLGFVLALFLTLPYSKFVHSIYRFAALIRHAAEGKSSGIS